MEPRNNIIAFTGNLPRTTYRAVLQWKKLFRDKYGEFGISHISLGSFLPEALQAEIESPPFLIEKKMVIVSVQIDGNTGNLGKYIDGTYWETLFKNTPNETTVIFYGFKATEIESPQKNSVKSKKPAAGKKKKSTSISQEEVESTLKAALLLFGKEKKYELLRESDFKKYILESLPKITPQNAELLQKRLGNIPEAIENEVQKLSLVNESLSPEVIIENTRENIESNAFEVLDALLSGNEKRGYEIIKKQLSHEDGIQVLRGYLGALRKPALYCSLILGGKTAAIALKITSIHEYAAKKYFSLPPQKKLAIIHLYLGLITIDTQGKTGKLIGDTEGYEHGILSEILNFSKVR